MELPDRDEANYDYLQAKRPPDLRRTPRFIPSLRMALDAMTGITRADTANENPSTTQGAL